MFEEKTITITENLDTLIRALIAKLVPQAVGAETDFGKLYMTGIVTGIAQTLDLLGLDYTGEIEKSFEEAFKIHEVQEQEEGPVQELAREDSE